MQKFQSTLPREERLAATEKDFEPARISIHAPTRGATCLLVVSVSVLIFQSTLPREERPFSWISSECWKYISIHAPTRGATILIVMVCVVDTFQSTLPREERQQYCTKNLFIFIQYRQ